MDKTLLTLLTLTIGAASLFIVVTETKSEEAHMTFVGANPFAIKDGIVNRTVTRIFAAFTFISFSIQGISTIIDVSLPQRLYDPSTYVIAFFLCVLLMAMSATIAKRVARRKWLPKLVSMMTEAFEFIEFVVEHDGWQKGQFENQHEQRSPEKTKQRNLEQAEEMMGRLEKLLEVKQLSAADDLKARLQSIKPFFGK